jgi:hypothetical protein
METKKSSPQDILVEAMEEFSKEEPDQIVVLMRYPRGESKAAYQFKSNDMRGSDILWMLEFIKGLVLNDPGPDED